MNGTFDPSSNVANSAFALGLDVAVKAVALLALCWFAHAALGRRQVLIRSALWNACLLGLLGLPLVDVVVPRLRVHVLPARRPSPGRLAFRETDVPLPTMSDNDVRARTVDDPTRGSSAGGEQQASNAPASQSQAAAKPGAAPSGTRREVRSPTRGPTPAAVRPWNHPDWAWLTAGLYLGVAGLLGLRLAISLTAVGRLRRGCTVVVAEEWREALDRWADHVGMRCPVALLQSDGVSVPAAVGHFRPAVVLPVSVAVPEKPGFGDAVLLHELAHLRRADFLWNVVRILVQILYWPHPLTWLLGPIIRSVREQACDDVCVHALGGAPAYRASLVEVASRLVRLPEPALGMAMARTSRLVRRLAWIDRTQGAPQCMPRWPVRLVVVATVVALAGVIGALEPTRAAVPQMRAEPHRNAAVTNLDKLITAIRAEEEKYRNVEYTLAADKQAYAGPLGKRVGFGFGKGFGREGDRATATATVNDGKNTIRVSVSAKGSNQLAALSRQDIQRELGLSDQQLQQLHGLQDKQERALRAVEPRNATDASQAVAVVKQLERAAEHVKKLVKEIDQIIATLLTAKQRQRLRELTSRDPEPV
jgi:beta-lactamase regulating signal transducer with metallopeptidase domain